MDFFVAVSAVQQHYQQQYEAFVEQQMSIGHGAAEVMFQLPPDPDGLFGDLYTVDFAFGPQNSGGARVVEMFPDKMLYVSQSEFKYDGVDIHLAPFRWDNISIGFDGAQPDLADWFEKWFDPNDTRYVATEVFGNRIHSVSLVQGQINVDLGSAEAQSLTDLIGVLKEAGTREVSIFTEVIEDSRQD